MFKLIRHYQRQDPVRPGFFEVILVYPGFHAIIFHRISHILWKIHLRLISRILAHFARFLTGIEIHPAARIGKNLFIDHGMGVVIGEATIIGNNVTLFHGVTLGGRGIPSSAKTKRHPTIGDNVVIGTGAKILGNVIIHHDAKIGPNSVILTDILASTIIGPPESKIMKSTEDWVI